MRRFPTSEQTSQATGKDWRGLLKDRLSEKAAQRRQFANETPKGCGVESTDA